MDGLARFFAPLPKPGLDAFVLGFFLVLILSFLK